MARTTTPRLAGLLAIAAAGLLSAPAATNAATIVVDTADDDGTPTGDCELREAITAANGNLGVDGCASGDAAPTVDRIGFTIGAPAPHVIEPTTALPSVDEIAMLDGATQPGGEEIRVDGDSAGAAATGIDIAADGAAVRGLTIVNFSFGVDLEGADGATVRDSLIGTNPAGDAGLGNVVGINVGLGASDAELRDNVVSGNSAGVLVEANNGARLVGNLIGTDPAGTAAVPNSTAISVSSAGSTVIGGPSAGERNVISGNVGTAIDFVGPGTVDNVVQGNLIGVGADGTTPLGNGGRGIRIDDTEEGNLIGGSGAGEGNVIAHSGGVAGIEVSGDTSGNTILGNSIFSSAGLGTDLQGNGVTPNDPGDADTGSNDLQNFPELDGAQTNSVDTSVQGTLDTKPNRSYRVELFSNPGCDGSGNGEGRTFLGAHNVQSNAAGVAQIAATVSPSSAGSQITATATDLGSGDTSEFSACAEAASKPEPPPPPPAADPPDTAVALDVDAKRRQRAGKLKLEVSCGDEPCEVEASGKAVAKKKKGGGKRRAATAAKKKSYKLKRASASPGANETLTLRLKLRKHSKSVKKLRKLLEDKPYRKRSKAKVDVAAADAAGNAATETITIKLRP